MYQKIVKFGQGLHAGPGRLLVVQWLANIKQKLILRNYKYSLFCEIKNSPMSLSPEATAQVSLEMMTMSTILTDERQIVVK